MTVCADSALNWLLCNYACISIAKLSHEYSMKLIAVPGRRGIVNAVFVHLEGHHSAPSLVLAIGNA